MTPSNQITVPNISGWEDFGIGFEPTLVAFPTHSQTTSKQIGVIGLSSIKNTSVFLFPITPNIAYSSSVIAGNLVWFDTLLK